MQLDSAKDGFSIMKFWRHAVVPLSAWSPLIRGLRHARRSNSVPEEMRSTDFAVAVNGKPVDVAHAAATYDYVSSTPPAPLKSPLPPRRDGFWTPELTFSRGDSEFAPNATAGTHHRV